MRSRQGATGTTSASSVDFEERLSTPLWWWLPALVVVGLVWLDLRLGHPSWPAWLAAVILVPVFAVAFHRLGRTRIGVLDAPGERMLRVGPASLPTRFIADTSVMTGEAKRVALGPELDPAAYILHRPWVRPLVRVTLNDPADPTPYWLFSTRRPDALLERLRASCAQSSSAQSSSAQPAASEGQPGQPTEAG